MYLSLFLSDTESGQTEAFSLLFTEFTLKIRRYFPLNVWVWEEFKLVVSFLIPAFSFVACTRHAHKLVDPSALRIIFIAVVLQDAFDSVLTWNWAEKSCVQTTRLCRSVRWRGMKLRCSFKLWIYSFLNLSSQYHWFWDQCISDSRLIQTPQVCVRFSFNFRHWLILFHQPIAISQRLGL